ncbi:MAG: adenosylmethionine decarboxylase [Fimbriimonas sp.]
MGLSRFRRLFNRKEEREMVVAEPPSIDNEAGWKLIHCEDPEAFSDWLGQDEEGLPPKPGEISSLGSHLLIELFGCDGATLEREDFVGDSMREAAVASKATVVAQSFHEFKPYGVSGAVIIQESHYTIHTWPEHGYAAVDLFYCGGTVLVHRAVDVLRERFKPQRIKFLVVRRGLQNEVDR